MRRFIRIMAVGIAAIVVLALFVRFNGHEIFAGHSEGSSGSRPALLSDAEFDDPDSAEAFNDRFGEGALLPDLINWLRDNHFNMDVEQGSATRIVGAFPCNELIRVIWVIDPETSRLLETKAVVSQPGCD